MKMMFVKLKRLSFIFIILTVTCCRVTLSAPKSWPYMKEYDIWDSTSNNTVETRQQRQQQLPKIMHENLINSDGMQNSSALRRTRGRKAKGELMNSSTIHSVVSCLLLRFLAYDKFSSHCWEIQKFSSWKSSSGKFNHSSCTWLS